MDRRKIKIAAVQRKSIAGDETANLSAIRELCEQAYKDGAEVICFPELSVSGADTEALGLELFQLADRIPGRITGQLSEIAQCCHLYIVIGLLQKSEVPGRLFTTQVVLNPVGSIKVIYQKNNLEGMEQLYLKGSIRKTNKTADLPFGKTGFLMGADIKSEEMLAEFQKKGVRFLFLSSAGGRMEQAVLQKAAQETGAYLVASDETESFVIAPDGIILAEAKRRGAQLAAADVCCI